jgi:hypothetical protein
LRAIRYDQGVGSAEIRFLHAIKSFWNRECADPRDKVYGLIGLVINGEEGRNLDISIDYSRGANMIFWGAFAIFEQFVNQ